MTVIPIRVNDRIKMKKPHPCGGSVFTVLRVGADVRIRCETCMRDLTMDRIKLERSIKGFVNADDTVQSLLEHTERNIK